MKPEFKIETSESEGTVRIAVEGELDLATAPSLDTQVRAAEATEAALIVIDLIGLTFMDSSGLRLLVDAHRRSRQTGDRLRLIEGPESVQKLIRMSGLAGELPLIKPINL